MRATWRHLLRRRHGLPVALWLLLLLSANALQVVAASHWHGNAIAAVASTGPAPHAPAPDGIDHDGCLLCQVAAHSGAAAPPPAPWSLYTVIESHAASLQDIQPAAPLLRPSHSWQGRAPPLA
jgi:hypothetical protein